MTQSIEMPSPTERQPARQNARSHAHAQFSCCALVLFAVAYWIVAVHPSSLAYLDYVDGYYLYMAQRMAQGAVLYSQLMGVQPPGIFVVGAFLFRLHSATATTRFYSGAVHVLTMLLVFGLARRVGQPWHVAVLAALLYSVAPYSLQWSRTFDPNPLVTLLSLLSVFAVLSGSRTGASCAGVVGALALATKIWFIPVGVATLVYLWIDKRGRLRWYLVAFLATSAIVATLGTLSAGTAFWHGLIAQDASPLDLAWFEAAIYDVVTRDWPVLLLATIGARFRFSVETRVHHAFSFYLVAALSVIGATIKQGTFAPIFQFAEPPLAVAAAVGIRGLTAELGRIRPGMRADSPVKLGLPLLVVLILLVPARPALDAARLQHDAAETTLMNVIAHHSSANSSILAPPYYAYLASRRMAGEYAELYLWGLYAAQGDRAARLQLDQTLLQLRHDQLPVVLADFRVLALSPLIHALLLAHYRQLPFVDGLPGDRSVTVWLPRGVPVRLRSAAP